MYQSPSTIRGAYNGITTIRIVWRIRGLPPFLCGLVTYEYNCERQRGRGDASDNRHAATIGPPTNTP